MLQKGQLYCVLLNDDEKRFYRLIIILSLISNM